MENKKEIGKAFKEKLNHLDKFPNEAVWNRIQYDLQKNKKRTYIYFPNCLKYVIFFTFTTLIINHLCQNSTDKSLEIHSLKLSSDKHIIPIKDTVSKIILNETTLEKKDLLLNEKEKFINKKIKDSRTSINGFFNNQTSNSKYKLKRANKKIYGNDGSKKTVLRKNTKTLSKKKNISNNKIFKHPIDSNQFLIQDDELKLITDKTKFSIEKDQSINEFESAKTDTLAQNKKKKNSHKKEEIKDLNIDTLNIEDKRKINIYIYGSPTYSGLLSKKSPISKTLDNNNVTSEITFSYGMYVTYKIAQKWIIRFGISKDNMRIITKDAIINTSNYYNIDYTKNISNTDVYNKSIVPKSIDIIQEISYIDLPLEVKYNIVDSKFGLGIFSGLSYMHLNQNSVTFDMNNSNKIIIGKTKDLSDKTYSFNIGLNLNYKISKKINFNIEPVFKYHLIDYNNNINPYTIGIQTGIEFVIGKL